MTSPKAKDIQASLPVIRRAFEVKRRVDLEPRRDVRASLRDSRFLACPGINLVQRPGINWTGASRAVPAKIGVDLRLSAADELFSRGFALGRHLSLAADERR
jgi:hypothetical protein